jgi:hypothetical protein
MLIISFVSIKLKNRTPNISEKLLSYTTNSFKEESNVRTLGIAMALLIMLKGTELRRAVLI